MLNRKFKKLVRNPNLFFSDMLAKKKKNITSLYSKKIDGNYEYTVVSAVYNVGRYLDDYFKSLVNQTLNFKKNIYLIMVDDGSVDDSAAIIKKWQSKYPDNILYVRKENGGQASARNLGLEYVKTEWVTFVDPDDFLNAGYFSNIDKELSKEKNKNIKMISCNIIMYLESSKSYKMSHPLSFKYENDVALKKIYALDREIQLSASSALFKYSDIKKKGILFDSNVKPNFEDAHFIANYFYDLEYEYVIFLKKSEYFYRKRDDSSSTLDTSWTKIERFSSVLKFGYLDILKKYHERYDKIPISIQNTVLYEMSWYIKWLDNRPERIAFLDEGQTLNFRNLLMEIFAYIDSDVIMNFNLAGTWFYHKWVMLSHFKNIIPEKQILYVDKYDRAKELIRFRYFTDVVGLEEYIVDGNDTYPSYTKDTKHDIAGEKVITERWVWISVRNAKRIEININCSNVNIAICGKQYNGEVPVSLLIEPLLSKYPQYTTRHEYVNSWVLMDRDLQADDNAEHLYRYIKEYHPEQKIFFALRKESRDWSRLEKEGFSLLDFGSTEHRLAIGGCRNLISSHANYYVTNLLGKQMLAGRHFIFLQHGITKDDISSWLNTKDSIDCFITASPYEYESICMDDSRYSYSRKELFLTGFPRYDNFFDNTVSNERIIVIMPTWRSGIVGKVVGNGDAREVKRDFKNTLYAKSWSGVLNSEKLKALSLSLDYKIVFIPHANILPYISELNIPSYIEIFNNNKSIQHLFKRASIMITDYSSVAFDMAIQNKQTIYYQFDEQEFFSSHNYTKGYFDYRENGFGDVCNNEHELLSSLSNALSNDCKPKPFVLDRIKKTFLYRDDKNCERTYEAIISLDKPLPDSSVDINIVRSFANKAMEKHRWELAEVRWKYYLSLSDKFDEVEVFLLAKTLRMRGKYDESICHLNLLVESCHSFNIKYQAIEERALLNMYMCLWDAAIKDWSLINKNNSKNILYCICLAYAKRVEELNKLLMDTYDESLNVLIDYANGNWSRLSEKLFIEEMDDTGVSTESYYQLLLRAHAHLMMGSIENSERILSQCSIAISDDIMYSCQMIRLYFYKKQYGKVIDGLRKIYFDVYCLPPEFLYYMVESLIFTQENNNAISIIEKTSQEHLISNDDKLFYGKALTSCCHFKEAADVLSEVHLTSFDAMYSYVLALKYAGEYELAFMAIKSWPLTFTANGWKLRSELAQLNNCWNDAYDCWVEYLSAAPCEIEMQDMSTLRKLKVINMSL